MDADRDSRTRHVRFLAGQFNNGNLFDPQNSDHASEADPDGDGWTNLLESIAVADQSAPPYSYRASLKCDHRKPVYNPIIKNHIRQVLFDGPLVLIGRLRAAEVADEEIGADKIAVGRFRRAVSGVEDADEFEAFSRLLEGGGELVG